MTALGSLCTGYGGLDMAAAAVIPGLRTAWVADTSPAAAALLAHHMPGIPNLGDITAIDWDAVEPVDVLTAGFPCQPVSNAGLRRGADDDRWIWPDDPDRPGVATAIRVLRPRLVLLENVAALAVRGLGDVLADLAALRYVGSWRCVRASDVGAPHRRERVFIAARPAADTAGARRQGGRPADPGWWPVAAGLAEDADRLGGERPGSAGRVPERHAARAGGAAPDAARDGRHERWPESARLVGRPDAALGGAAPTDADSSALGQERDGQSYGPEADHEHGGPHTRGRLLDWGPYGPAIDRWASILGRPAPAPTEPGRNGQRLAPGFVEWLMGLDAGHVTDVPGLSRNAQLALLGNGVVPQQAAYAYAALLGHAEAGAA